MKKIAIIGAGASGVICALKLKQLNKEFEVVIFERDEKILRKVLLSGSGKCNLSNANISPDKYTNGKLVKTLLDAGYKNKPEEFFKEIGLLMQEDREGRIYPFTFDSRTVYDVLANELYYRRIDVRCGLNITSIKKVGSKYEILENLFDDVIIATGSMAKNTNSNYYELLINLGLTLNDLKPGLVGFKVEEDVKDLLGVRAKATVYNSSFKSFGEVNFRVDGISGICVMDLSNYYDYADKALYIDFLPNYSIDDLVAFKDSLLAHDENLHLHNLFKGAVHFKVLKYINKNFENSLVSALNYNDLLLYFECFKHFKLTIKDTYGFMDAQVTRGGVSINEINNFKLTKYENIYILGEAIDNVGVCGGYNLWFAFATGLYVADLIGGGNNES